MLCLTLTRLASFNSKLLCSHSLRALFVVLLPDRMRCRLELMSWTASISLHNVAVILISSQIWQSTQLHNHIESRTSADQENAFSWRYKQLCLASSISPLHVPCFLDPSLNACRFHPKICNSDDRLTAWRRQQSCTSLRYLEQIKVTKAWADFLSSSIPYRGLWMDLWAASHHTAKTMAPSVGNIWIWLPTAKTSSSKEV